ncbi:MAG: YceI family protein [Ignavibacteria bacterium]|nr:YceI family protein [Ignavibacteria bacterium]MBT8382898.1 YceI family protein [Ignavibacteria bacterium]MBT8391721.1 YceI family protein [Ignavibacteria bacterium]NNJ53828.1 YceI family protein [Ignavibacteriaceae bacterium]NNL20092.1 YceI family protein [Ignavibacteriaceae bacterium]
MKVIIKFIVIAVISAVAIFPQGFNVKATGGQTFSFEDKYGRNQATFFSTTPLEDITGITNNIKGSVTFNVNDFSTLNGKISISVASIKTGIDLRDEHLRSANWLDAESYPEAVFEIKKVSDIQVLEQNKLKAQVTGDFSTHGVIKEVVADATVTYLDESEDTKKRAAGDLLGVQVKFNIILSDFDVDNMVLGQKVSDDIEISVNIVGSNAQ